MELSSWRFTWKFTRYLLDYMGVLWVFFVISVLGTVALAISLLCFESHIDYSSLLASSSASAAPIPPSVEGQGRVADHSQEAALSTPRNANADKQLRQIREELVQISAALSDMNREASSQFHSEANRLDALDGRLRKLTTYWRTIEQSRRMNFGYALYDTIVAMLGEGDFGARSDGGKVIVVLAGCWGVFTFWLITVVLMWAVNRAYYELLKDAAGKL